MGNEENYMTQNFVMNKLLMSLVQQSSQRYYDGTSM